MDLPEERPIEVPITDEIDLHTFRPNEIGSLLPEYFRACREKGLARVRVVHGKGTGALRAGVHQLLARLPEVVAFQWPAPEGEGGWGATWVELRRG
ncbi:MAG: Smr/MutS family protein [Verrucomicrobiota bacterium]